jgi:hypothetical protein
MERAVRDSNKVVVVCTSTYVDKAESRIGGAGYESALVTAELVAAQGTSKFIPLLRDNPEGRIPAFLAGRVYIDFRDDALYEDSIAILLRAIHDLPALDPPPIGQSPFETSSPTSQEAPLISEARPDSDVSVDLVEELLQNPHRRIQLSKLFWSAAQRARAQLQDGRMYSFGDQPTAELINSRASLAESSLQTLLPLLFTIGRWANREQIPVAAQTIAHLLDMPDPSGPYYDTNLQIARYPALLALYACGLGALVEDRLDNLRALFFAGVPSRARDEQDRPLVQALHHGAPFAQSFWNLLEGKDRRHTPLSDHTLERLTGLLPEAMTPAAKGERLFDRLESLVSLGYLDAEPDPDEMGWAPLGSYLWRDRAIINRMKDELGRVGAAWPPILAGFFQGSTDRASAVMDHLADHIGRVRQQRGVF